jgi:hypothetical protein
MALGRRMIRNPQLEPLRMQQRLAHQADRAAAFTFRRQACKSGSV